MKRKSETQNQVDAASPTPVPKDPAMPQRIASPSSPRPPTFQFQEIQVGQHFEFRGRRYKILALSMASDEDRIGDMFQAHHGWVGDDPV